MWATVRRFGQWLVDLPCEKGRHQWVLYSPGAVMWWRRCIRCGASEEVDMAAYNRYLERHDCPKESP